MKKFTDKLPNVIGQNKIKRKLNFLLAGMEHTGIMPHMFLSAEAGGGKSFIAKQIAIATSNVQEKRTGERRKFAHINAGQFTSIKDFGAFMFETVNETPITVLIDEAHGLSPKVTNRLLSMLEPSNTNKGFFAIGGGDTEERMEVDFSLATFIFATTEKDKMFKPLMDRLTEIALEPLDNVELGMIILSQCDPSANVTTEAVVDLVSRLRMNGRSAIKMGENVNAFLAAYDVEEFDRNSAKELFEVLNILPMGLTSEEVRVLEFLRAHPQGARLLDVANHVSQGTLVVRDMEQYLLRRGLMAVDGKRFITKEGKEYLDELN
jgi:Holliday junction resolvasome RuvABC ATP-dependent DNA helicase subunit